MTGWTLAIAYCWPVTLAHTRMARYNTISKKRNYKTQAIEYLRLKINFNHTYAYALGFAFRVPVLGYWQSKQVLDSTPVSVG